MTTPSSRQGRHQPAPPASSASPTPPDAFPIVGIGASAGGLEALTHFLRPVSPDSGMAFIIVQHLDPNHPSLLTELLQRTTPLPIEEIQDRVKVEPNHIYIIPPNHDLSLLHGALRLSEPSSPRGLRLPIDVFFRSLAEDQQDRSLGVILSGMGSDGTLGLRAIKEVGGVTLVQALATAQFDAMPRSAIQAGLADIVAPAEALYERLVVYLSHRSLIALPPASLNDRDPNVLDPVFILLRTHSGHDFSQYKKATLYRRIERRMGLHRLDNIAHYVRYLQENPPEVERLFKELLIGVTHFFRDSAAWTQLQQQVIPVLLADRPAGGRLRAWSVGCATGEEAYSLAILFQETVEQRNSPQALAWQIFATDLDQDAIAEARKGVYRENMASDVSPERLQRFLIKDEEGHYRVGAEIRARVTFALHNVIMDPPFTKLDLLICRNLLIYLTAELQTQLLSLFHFSLNPGGFLFLGSAETIGNESNLFEALPGHQRLYRRKTFAAQRGSVHFPSAFKPIPGGVVRKTDAAQPMASLQKQADRLLLHQFSPAAVLTNAQGDILYINGRTGQYLEPAAGSAQWNLFVMAREGLHQELPTLFQQVLHQASPAAITRRGLRIKTNSHFQVVDLTLQALREPNALCGLILVVFAEVAGSPRTRKRSNAAGAVLNPETQQLREALQATREEMQTSQEELQSTNEEMQSTNEELQSANEELTTSKEEMQSLNEELQTINAELQAKVEELSQTNNDMKNLLNSTEIATLFLDEALRVRRFTLQAAKLINLIPGDVGRPITDIASDLIYPELATEVGEVLRTLMSVEKSIHTQDGRWFTARIMPYRTLDNRINGVVLTLIDITLAKVLEEELRQAQDALSTRLTDKTDELAQLRTTLHDEPGQG